MHATCLPDSLTCVCEGTHHHSVPGVLELLLHAQPWPFIDHTGHQVGLTLPLSSSSWCVLDFGKGPAASQVHAHTLSPDTRPLPAAGPRAQPSCALSPLVSAPAHLRVSANRDSHAGRCISSSGLFGDKWALWQSDWVGSQLCHGGRWRWVAVGLC